MALTDNTQKINQLLDAINALPDAGGGSADPVLQPLTVTPSEAEQEFTPNGFDGYSSVKVDAVSKTYVGSNVPRKSAEEIRPGTASREIESGTYLTGKQIILGDANLTAENIKEGVRIFDVLGTFAGSGGGSGGLPIGIKALASDTVTPTTDGSTLKITHNLGAVPNFLVWWNTTDFSSSVETSAAYLGVGFEKQIKTSAAGTTVVNHHYSVHGYNSNGGTGQTGSRLQNTTRMTDTIATLTSNTTYPIKAGHTYRWVCGVVE